MDSLLTVMYHFVANAEDTPWPKLVSCRLETFRQQLDDLCRRREPVTLADVRDCCTGKRPLPPRAFLLTFDHGTRDHRDNVLPELLARGLTGTFFVYTQVQKEGRLCPEDKQRYLEYRTGTIDLWALARRLVALDPALDPKVVEPRPENLVLARDYLKPYAFYSDQERFLRKVRDLCVRREVFAAAIEGLFEEAFGSEAEFARRHYLSWEDLAEMTALGMDVAGHGHRHLPMARSTAEAQAEDIRRNTQLLRERLRVEAYAFAYPNGNFNADTLAALRHAGVEVAFTTNPATGFRAEAPLEIGRVDTTALPTPRPNGCEPGTLTLTKGGGTEGATESGR